MSTETQPKTPNLLSWITSIATSVLCCATLFVFFASYLVELRTTARDNNVRIDVIEQRENQILSELELIRKHAEGQTPAAAVVQPPANEVVAPVAPAASEAPTSIVPPTPDAAPPSPAAMPHVEVPVVAPPADKK